MEDGQDPRGAGALLRDDRAVGDVAGGEREGVAAEEREAVHLALEAECAVHEVLLERGDGLVGRTGFRFELVVVAAVAGAATLYAGSRGAVDGYHQQAVALLPGGHYEGDQFTLGRLVAVGRVDGDRALRGLVGVLGVQHADARAEVDRRWLLVRRLQVLAAVACLAPAGSLEPAVLEGGRELQPRHRLGLDLTPDGMPQRRCDGRSVFSHVHGLGEGAGRALVAQPQEPVGWHCRLSGARRALAPRRFLQDAGVGKCLGGILVGFWEYGKFRVRVEGLVGAPRLIAGEVALDRRCRFGLLEESGEHPLPLGVLPQLAPAEEDGTALLNAAVGPVAPGLPARGRGGCRDVGVGVAFEVLGAKGPIEAAVAVEGRLHSEVAMRVSAPTVPRAWGEDDRVA